MENNTKDKHIEELKNVFLKLKQETVVVLGAVDASKLTYLQTYLYYAHHPVFSFTESIIILCVEGKPKVASVLLRTLFEVHIDVTYHQVSNSEQRLALSARRVLDERITMLNEIMGLVKKYPNLSSPDPGQLFNEEYLINAIKIQEVSRQAVLKGNPGLQEMNKVKLRTKAELCDESKVEGAEHGHYSRMYSLIYRMLSPIAHLNVEGLQAFVGQDDHGKNFFEDGEDGDFIAGQAISICLAFTKDLYDNKVLNGVYTKTIVDVEEILKGPDIVTLIKSVV